MFKVVGYEERDKDQVVAFLRKAQANIEPELEVLNRSTLITGAEGVVGMVSYGAYGDVGVIRYFLYDACLSGTDLIVHLFFELYKKAHSEGINCLAIGVNNEEAKQLLGLLGFTTRVKALPKALQESLHEHAQIMTINLDQSL